MPAVSVRHLAKSYGDKQAVRDVSFDVERGDVFALLGPNGAGKTTTIEILEGFRDRSGGEVETLGVDPANKSTQRWLRTRIGVVLQELAVEPYYSVRQVLSRNAGYYPSPRPVPEVIELIGLKEKADDKVKTLSGGQQRRLDVGLGIIGNPELLFLDEPTTGLDPSGRRDTWDLIRQLTSLGTTVMLTTHYMDEVEALADRVAVLNNAEIVAAGTPTSIGGRDSSEVTIRFLLPEGTAVSDLPVAVDRLDQGLVEIRTHDELRLLHEPDRVGARARPCADRALGGPGHPRRRLPAPDQGCDGAGGEVGQVSTTSPPTPNPTPYPSTPTTGSFHGVSDLRLVGRQVWYEQLSFWLNPLGAFFTLGFSTIFLVLLGSIAGSSKIGSGYGAVKLVQYYLASFVAYAIMAACFTVLASTLVNRREMGLLKRLRLSPVPTWSLLSAIFLSTMLVALLQVGILLAVGTLAFGDYLPPHGLAFILTIVVGMFSFTALGIGMSTLVPNPDAAGPMISIVFFLLLAFSGLYFPIKPGSTLANISGYFPVRHLINATLASFNLPPGANPWAWHDLFVMVIWGLGGVLVAVRRWRWAPRRG